MRYNLLVVAKTCPESNRSVLLYPTEWIIIGRIFVVIKHTHTSPSMHTSASAAHGNMRAHTLWRESKQTQHIYEHLISFGLCFGCVWMCVSCRVRSRGSVSSFSEQNILNKCYTSSSLYFFCGNHFSVLDGAASTLTLCALHACIALIIKKISVLWLHCHYSW